MLLQVFDDGRLTDGKGRTVDFKNTVIIMTSNIASQQIQQLREEERADWEIEAHVKDVLRKVFKPEFLNRIDEIIVFHTLSKEHLKKIVDIQLGYLAERLAARSLKVEFTDQARKAVIDEGYDPVYGARPLKRVIQQRLENPLATQLLSGEFADGDTVKIDSDGHKFVFVKA